MSSRFMQARRPASVTSIVCDVCQKRTNDGDHIACGFLRKQKEIERKRYIQCLADLEVSERQALKDAYDRTRSFEEITNLLVRTQQIVDADAHTKQSLLSAMVIAFDVVSSNATRATEG